MMYRTLPLNQPRPLIQFHETPSSILVPWGEVERLLGRPYAITVEDDELVLAALEIVKAPAWVRWGIGALENEGWMLRRPRGI